MKKHLLNSVFLILVLTSCAMSVPTPTAAEIEKEEQAVYAFFVSGNIGTALILEETSTNITGQDSKEIEEHVKSGLKAVSNEAVESYIERNA